MFHLINELIRLVVMFFIVIAVAAGFIYAFVIDPARHMKRLPERKNPSTPDQQEADTE
jgi:hypothetical protein